MIRKIGSDQQSFKTLTFHSGLNVLLADKTAGSHDRQSRNGAGKTSFVELVHFIFGANAPPNGIFRSDALVDWTFNLTVDIHGNTVTVARSGRKSSRIQVDGLAYDSLGLPRPLIDSRSYLIRNMQWRTVLGDLWFGLPSEVDGSTKYLPTFRSLFPLFARRQESGGFQNPTQHTTMQQGWLEQVSVSYLLGLDWTISRKFQQLRVRDTDTKKLRNLFRSGIAGTGLKTAAEVRTKLTVANARTKRLRERLDAFRVVPEYKELEEEADRITKRVNDSNSANVADRALIRELQASIAAEDSPEVGDLERLYAESGIVLPELPRRRFEDVARFHQAVIKNRCSHLETEIDSATQRIATRDEKNMELDRRRRQIMELLQSGGALEHYTRLREELGRTEGESEMLRERLKIAERLETSSTEIDLKRAQLLRALQDDIRERDEIVGEAILQFEELSQALYERAGSLTVSATKAGPRFEFRIDAERSKGITNMQIFCFDLMLTEMCARHDRSPGFLIHDSHLFDGVDERQVAKALQLGAQRAEAGGFQYIVTLNSDAFPTEGFRPGFDLKEHVIDTRLTDATETGGLFGIRFN